jgi:hypothetical protein
MHRLKWRNTTDYAEHITTTFTMKTALADVTWQQYCEKEENRQGEKGSKGVMQKKDINLFIDWKQEATCGTTFSSQVDKSDFIHHTCKITHGSAARVIIIAH